MTALRHTLLALAIFQVLSTLIGFFTLLLGPQMYAEALGPTFMRGQYLLAALILGVLVGGFQWAAVYLHLRRPRWLTAGHTVAGFVMVCWIGVECLVLNSFIWPHALWGGLGLLQLTLVAILLGAFQPRAQR